MPGIDRPMLVRLFAIICLSAAVGGMIFQSTTFTPPKILDDRLGNLAGTSTLVGQYAFVVFAIAAFAQLAVPQAPFSRRNACVNPAPNRHSVSWRRRIADIRPREGRAMGHGGREAASDELEANKALVRRTYAEWWNANGNVESVDEMVRPDFIGHLGGGKVRDIESLRHDIRTYQGGLGGLREVVEDLIAEGDRVVVRYSLYGTHTGDFYGAAPTGKAVKVGGIEIFRIEDGKLAEFWHFGEAIDLSREPGDNT